MKRFTGFIIAAFLVSTGYDAAAFPGRKPTFMAGTAKVNITPRLPIPMSGYGGRKDAFKGVHDSLFARIVVLSDGINKAALITTELIGISNAFWEELTASLERKTGIKKEFVFLAAVHNHSGPVTNVYNESPTPAVAAYVEETISKIIDATSEAASRMVTVQIGVGKGECKMNINRRAPNGKGQISLGRNPYAPCDQEVGVIRITQHAGKELAVIMNWPCHATVLGPRNYQITSDWPGAASRFVEDGMAEDFIAPVTIGASGDINPIYGPNIDFEQNNAYAFGKDAIGEDLARETKRVASEIKKFSKGEISASQRVIFLPAKEKTQDSGRFLQPKSTVDDYLQVRLSVLKIGNIVLTGVSGEVFNQISVKMRARSPYAATFMVTHCNGSSGYLVTDDAYPVPGNTGAGEKTNPVGGYEANSTRAKPGAEQLIIKNLLEMIKAI